MIINETTVALHLQWLLHAAVIVLTKEFAAKWAPMEELKIFLSRHVDPQDSLVIVPVLPQDGWECFEQVEEQVYQAMDQVPQSWPNGNRPDDSTRGEWAERIKQLVDITCLRGDQVRAVVMVALCACIVAVNRCMHTGLLVL
jgi:hypothetical protein